MKRLRAAEVLDSGAIEVTYILTYIHKIWSLSLYVHYEMKCKNNAEADADTFEMFDSC